MRQDILIRFLLGCFQDRDAIVEAGGVGVLLDVARHVGMPVHTHVLWACPQPCLDPVCCPSHVAMSVGMSAKKLVCPVQQCRDMPGPVYRHVYSAICA